MHQQNGHYVGKVLMGLSVALLCQQEDKPGRVGGEPVPSKADKVGSGQTSSGKPSEKVGKTWLDLTCLAMLCCGEWSTELCPSWLLSHLSFT